MPSPQGRGGSPAFWERGRRPHRGGGVKGARFRGENPAALSVRGGGLSAERELPPHTHPAVKFIPLP